MTRRADRGAPDRGRHRRWSLVAVAAVALVVAGCVPPPSSTPRPDVVEVDLAVGGRHTCAIQDGGAVYCWGANDRGQLGNGTTSAGATTGPVRVVGIEGAVALSLGVDSSCALLTDRTVWCWGANEHGQVGNGAISDDATPLPLRVTGLPGVVALGGGSGSGQAPFCAVDRDRVVWCWGAGQLIATPVPGLGEAGRVDASEHTICVVRASGRVACIEHGAPVRTLPFIDDAVDLAVGDLHHCAVPASGGVRCWGENGSSQLGTAAAALPSSDDPVAPTANDNVDSAVSVAVASPSADTGYTCAIADQLPYCWGRLFLYTGFLPTTGFTTRTPAAPWRMPTTMPAAESIAAHTTHTCARAEDRSVWCWGLNGSGQLGTGFTADTHRGLQVVDLP